MTQVSAVRLLVIPWRYVRENYVTRAGDPVSNRGAPA
jgi:hypothetical protein